MLTKINVPTQKSQKNIFQGNNKKWNNNLTLTLWLTKIEWKRRTWEREKKIIPLVPNRKPHHFLIILIIKQIISINLKSPHKFRSLHFIRFSYMASIENQTRKSLLRLLYDIFFFCSLSKPVFPTAISYIHFVHTYIFTTRLFIVDGWHGDQLNHK